MLYVKPNYYNKFKCINKDCKHNCCIGWEIEIDNETLNYYKTVNGEIGKKLNENILESSFTLQNNRCPFLQQDGLCELIINLGESSLCEICKEHPRFNNQLPNRIESGLGLSCEEAARIILNEKAPVKLTYSQKEAEIDSLIEHRDRIIALLQNRTLNLDERFETAFNYLNINFEDNSLEYWVNLFLSLERLDEAWITLLNKFKLNLNNIDFNSFNEYIKGRAYEYEQIAVYIIYRYFANSYDIDDACAVLIYAKVIYTLLYSLGAYMYSTTGNFNFEDQVEVCRMFSSEIEYSDENMDIILQEIYSLY